MALLRDHGDGAVLLAVGGAAEASCQHDPQRRRCRADSLAAIGDGGERGDDGRRKEQHLCSWPRRACGARPAAAGGRTARDTTDSGTRRGGSATRVDSVIGSQASRPPQLEAVSNTAGLAAGR